MRRYKAERRGIAYDHTANLSRFGLDPALVAAPDMDDPYDIGDQILAPTEKSRQAEPVSVDLDLATTMEQVRIASEQLEAAQQSSGVDVAGKRDGQGLIVDVEN